MPDEILGAVETAAAIAAGRTSAKEACAAAIARIERLDGPINAVVVRDFERALEAAAEADAKLAKGERAPLLGVPMTIKESFEIAGLPTTWGFEHARNAIAKEDAVAVTRLKQAGAVLLGKTNVPVALGDWQTFNPIYGRTNNPFDLSRSPGGSSGGSAAALASCMVPLEIGSDIGGSVRVPAHFCGLFGHKPTYGVLPMRGHRPPGADGVPPPLGVIGPMARTMTDVRAAFDILLGPDLVEAEAWKLDLPPPRAQQLKDFRILVLDQHPTADADSQVRGALAALAAALEQCGARISRRSDKLPDLERAQRAYSKMIATVTSRRAPGAPPPISAHDYLDVEDEQARTQCAWRELFADVDVVLAPPFGTPAFAHEERPFAERTLRIDDATTRYGAQIAWPALATFPHIPSTAAPIARSREGLPIGVQIIGPFYGDLTTLTFAALLEREGLTNAATGIIPA
jgi:amidase